MTTVEPELEALLLRELLRAWKNLNVSHFSDGMRPPTLELSDGLRMLGSWQRGPRTLSLSRRLLREGSWSAVCEVLKHEMAHQYVDEVLQVRDEAAHGPAFQRTCRKRAIDPAASGLPEHDGQSPRIVRKVQRLLALAESPNPHEAQSAMRAARRLMLRYNLDMTGGERRYRFQQLGRPMKQRPAHHKILASILLDHFFVSGIWISAVDLETGARGRALEIAGTPANVEIAAWVHGYLLETAERLWRQRRSGRGRGRFLSGVMLGFQEKLGEQARETEEAGLVWLGDADLGAYVRTRHPHQRSGRGVSLRDDQALRDGQQAGRKIALRRPVRGGPGPRLLTDGDG
ncbi:MAG: hypothetical protein ACI8S6_000811 [Myxococcota bacterium]|jgi:hypothetical protein